MIPKHTYTCWKITGAREIGAALRTSVDFLLGNHLLLRYSNRSPIELPDLPNEGHKPSDKSPADPLLTTKAFVVIMRQGKTNIHGRVEYGAALRHRNPQACLIGAIAFFLFFPVGKSKALSPFPAAKIGTESSS